MFLVLAKIWFLIPITSSKVSYGFPVIERSVSPGLKSPKKVAVKAWVPDINWLLTKAFSLFKTYAHSIFEEIQI